MSLKDDVTISLTKFHLVLTVVAAAVAAVVWPVTFYLRTESSLENLDQFAKDQKGTIQAQDQRIRYLESTVVGMSVNVQWLVDEQRRRSLATTGGGR